MPCNVRFQLRQLQPLVPSVLPPLRPCSTVRRQVECGTSGCNCRSWNRTLHGMLHHLPPQQSKATRATGGRRLHRDPG